MGRYSRVTACLLWWRRWRRFVLDAAWMIAMLLLIALTVVYLVKAV